MNRREFTDKITRFIQRMIQSGESPVIDYALRSAEEQFNLYKKGRKLIEGQWVVVSEADKVTNFDGYNKVSPHQKGTAMDIYLVDIVDGQPEVKYIWDSIKSEYWHNIWFTEFGGQPRIVWISGKTDDPHFEG